MQLLPTRSNSDYSWSVSREEIERKNYDLKAVNPYVKLEEDSQTPEELLEFITALGKEIDDILTILKS